MRLKGQTMLISALVFALLIAIFAVINVDSVQVNFLFTKTTLPLILVILISTLLGGLTAGLLAIVRQIRLQRTIKLLQRQVEELTAEVELDASIHEAEGHDLQQRKDVFQKSASQPEMNER